MNELIKKLKNFNIISILPYLFQKVPLHLSYRIFESSPKRIKLSEDNVNYKTSLFYAGINPIELKEEEPIKREWKEVQLKISETGIMSITDISDQEFKKNTKVEEPVTSIETINTSIIQESANDNNTPEITKKNEHPSNKQIDDCNVSAKLNEFDGKKISNETEVKKMLTKETENMMSKSEEEAKDQLDNNNITDKLALHTNVQFRETTHSVLEDERKVNVVDDKDKKDSSKNNNSIIIAEKNGETLKRYPKNEVKLLNMGSKINALSVKLQFQPKIGQLNSSNTSSKKTIKDKKIMPQLSKKVDTKTIHTLQPIDSKNSFDTSKTQSNNCEMIGSKALVPCSTRMMSQKPMSETEEIAESDVSMHITTTINCKSGETKFSVKNVQLIDLTCFCFSFNEGIERTFEVLVS